MNRLITLMIAAAISAYFIGCGNIPRPLPGEHQSAHELNVSGNRAFEDGKYGKALALYEQALRVNLSIEDTEGAAMNLFNIAAAHRRLDDEDAALAALGEILADDTRDFVGPNMAAKAAYFMGVIHASRTDSQEAANYAEQASTYCAETEDCKLEGQILNLKARIAMDSGIYDIAVDAATTGLKVNVSGGDMREAANSHRLLGDAHSHTDSWELSLLHYESALAADKELGLPDKVGLDIESIGTVLCRSGRHLEAREYFKRAKTAYLNAGLVMGYETSSELLEVCYTHPSGR
jgi:tetratricopeptide (TPR) repeat protein